MLCDEMGLGKTIQAIAIACCYRTEWPLLIIVPAALRFTWKSEIVKWLPEYQHTISVVESGKGLINKLINVVPYTLVGTLKEKIEAAKFKVIICDECHYIKSQEAQRTQAVIPFLQAAKRNILISGTPAVSRPSELYSQLVSLGASIFPEFHSFGLRYCSAFKGPMGWDYSGSSNLTELNVLLNESVMIRRRKEDVLHELPPKKRHFPKIEPDLTHQGDLKEIKEKIDAAGKKAANAVGNTELYARFVQEKKALITKFFGASGLAKVRPALAYIQDLIASGQDKILIFAHHIEVLDNLCMALGSTKLKFLRVDGSTNPKQKEVIMNRFSQDPSVTLFLLSLTCAGVGYTLTAASCVVFVELFWTPASLIQAEDRVHRIGQRKPVHIHYLLCSKTIDDVIWPTISRKLEVISRSVDGKAGVSMEAKEMLVVDGILDFEPKTLVKEIPGDPIVSTPVKRTGDTKKQTILNFGLKSSTAPLGTKLFCLPDSKQPKDTSQDTNIDPSDTSTFAFGEFGIEDLAEDANNSETQKIKSKSGSWQSSSLEDFDLDACLQSSEASGWTKGKSSNFHMEELENTKGKRKKRDDTKLKRSRSKTSSDADLEDFDLEDPQYVLQLQPNAKKQKVERKDGWYQGILSLDLPQSDSPRKVEKETEEKKAKGLSPKMSKAAELTRNLSFDMNPLENFDDLHPPPIQESHPKPSEPQKGNGKTKKATKDVSTPQKPSKRVEKGSASKEKAQSVFSFQTFSRPPIQFETKPQKSHTDSPKKNPKPATQVICLDDSFDEEHPTITQKSSNRTKMLSLTHEDEDEPFQNIGERKAIPKKRNRAHTDRYRNDDWSTEEEGYSLDQYSADEREPLDKLYDEDLDEDYVVQSSSGDEEVQEKRKTVNFLCLSDSQSTIEIDLIGNEKEESDKKKESNRDQPKKSQQGVTHTEQMVEKRKSLIEEEKPKKRHEEKHPKKHEEKKEVTQEEMSKKSKTKDHKRETHETVKNEEVLDEEAKGKKQKDQKGIDNERDSSSETKQPKNKHNNQKGETQAEENGSKKHKKEEARATKRKESLSSEDRPKKKHKNETEFTEGNPKKRHQESLASEENKLKKKHKKKEAHTSKRSKESSSSEEEKPKKKRKENLSSEEDKRKKKHKHNNHKGELTEEIEEEKERLSGKAVNQNGAKEKEHISKKNKETEHSESAYSGKERKPLSLTKNGKQCKRVDAEKEKGITEERPKGSEATEKIENLALEDDKLNKNQKGTNTTQIELLSPKKDTIIDLDSQRSLPQVNKPPRPLPKEQKPSFKKDNKGLERRPSRIIIPSVSNPEPEANVTPNYTKTSLQLSPKLLNRTSNRTLNQMPNALTHKPIVQILSKPLKLHKPPISVASVVNVSPQEQNVSKIPNQSNLETLVSTNPIQTKTSSVEEKETSKLSLLSQKKLFPITSENEPTKTPPTQSDRTSEAETPITNLQKKTSTEETTLNPQEITQAKVSPSQSAPKSKPLKLLLGSSNSQKLSLAKPTKRKTESTSQPIEETNTLPSVGQYVDYLERLDISRQKSELQTFHFKIYQTQSNSYAHQPLKLYSPSADFNPKFNDTFSGILYPRPVQLTHGRPQNQTEPQEEHEKALCADEINNFLDPFFSELLTERFPVDKSDEILHNVVSRLQNYIEEKRDDLNTLALAMNVKRLVIPFVEINLPGDLILAYNELEPDDPQISWYQNHPLIAADIRLLGTFLDRFDTNSEVLCLMVWSTIDSVLISLPSVGLNPYPLCWDCRKSFGMKVCGVCKIAKYCSRDCQLRHWDCNDKMNHKSICQEMKDLCKKHKTLIFNASSDTPATTEKH